LAEENALLINISACVSLYKRGGITAAQPKRVAKAVTAISSAGILRRSRHGFSGINSIIPMPLPLTKLEISKMEVSKATKSLTIQPTALLTSTQWKRHGAMNVFESRHSASVIPSIGSMQIIFTPSQPFRLHAFFSSVA